MNKKLDPTDWVDYLLQTGAVDSWGEYAEWVKSTPKPEIAQALANQPVDTPQVDDLITWANQFTNQ
jgi:hypothetical protein